MSRHVPDAPMPVVPGVPPAFVSMLVVGRTTIVATIVLFLVLRHPFAIDREAVTIIGAVTALYTIVQWLLLRTRRIGPYPPALLIGVDLALVTALIWYSGGTRSPFLGLYYLLIIVSAAFGDLRGSLLTAIAISLLQLLAVAIRRPGAESVLRVENAISTFPYFLLTAAVSGVLVRALRGQWESRQEAEARLAEIHRELEIATQVQRALMDHPIPHVPGLVIARHTQPLFGVGGDLQEYVPLPDGVGLVLADVAGHSLAAALLAVRLSQALEGIGLGLPLPAVLSAWNQTVYTYTPEDVFATAAFLQVRPADGHVYYASAGHPPLLIWRRATRRVEVIESCGSYALGISREAEFPICEVHLAPGDLGLLYTDGAIEARDAQGKMLDIGGLTRLLEQYGDLPPAEAVACLAREIVSGRQLRDDLTLLALVCTGSA